MLIHIYEYILAECISAKCVYMRNMYIHICGEYIYIYVMNIRLLIAVQCIHTVLRTYLPTALATWIFSHW